MGTFSGFERDPITLHKYVYGNVDPINNIDPSGNFLLGSFSAASRITGILNTFSTIESGFSIL